MPIDIKSNTMVVLLLHSIFPYYNNQSSFYKILHFILHESLLSIKQQKLIYTCLLKIHVHEIFYIFYLILEKGHLVPWFTPWICFTWKVDWFCWHVQIWSAFAYSPYMYIASMFYQAREKQEYVSSWPGVQWLIYMQFLKECPCKGWIYLDNFHVLRIESMHHLQ